MMNDKQPVTHQTTAADLRSKVDQSTISLVRFGRALWCEGLRVYGRLFERHRYHKLVFEHVAGRPMVVLPEIFNPTLLRTGEYFVQTFGAHLIPPTASVLDSGTGSGIGAVVAASWARRVIAVDIDPEAVRCARINVLINRVESRVDVREGDLFAPVQGERFDVVLFNPPSYHGTPRKTFDRAWRSNDTVDRFVANLRSHLTLNGYALMILSTDGEADAILRTFRNNGFQIDVITDYDLLNDKLTVYKIRG
ncbi:MAG: methyltransferase [Chloroflexi bacterium AL-W]|nr:methyltransferase [Chloroflexi bacterium AL-N1]NOK69486.1 methyltransferase [Chloroflexi bacterium AL-N10]NOK77451.1 methyltransferase [Chloroflexi bacterium AL-N5]NOK84302.1 methyltransferase [Chloroflexi bacterium AL-W]NOK91532.1 methyltransferase [Chloroflexi bacterium AL-N15]